MPEPIGKQPRGHIGAVAKKALAPMGRHVRKGTTEFRRLLRLALDATICGFHEADIAIFHNFVPPPYGGGNQFLLALRKEFEKLGFRTEANKISRKTRCCVYNSFNFDFDRLRKYARTGCRMIHRVDGPVGVYRGRDDGIDHQVCQINNELADATVFQSYYSLQKHLELGMQFRVPRVIHNASDPDIFHSRGRPEFDGNRKVRIISTSWSDNPNKGATFYKRFEEMLDRNRFEYTFVGRSPIRFDFIKMIDPVGSAEVARLLREHDIFIAASKHEPCSNSLVEALSCGLPVLYRNSGSHGELVGDAGFCFSTEEEALVLLDRLVEEYERRQKLISVPSIAQVVQEYLTVLGLDATVNMGK
jgi:glycosyltransferase involved in cell wall biosynthesis